MLRPHGCLELPTGQPGHPLRSFLQAKSPYTDCPVCATGSAIIAAPTAVSTAPGSMYKACLLQPFLLCCSCQALHLGKILCLLSVGSWPEKGLWPAEVPVLWMRPILEGYRHL